MIAKKRVEHDLIWWVLCEKRVYLLKLKMDIHDLIKNQP